MAVTTNLSNRQVDLLMLSTPPVTEGSDASVSMDFGLTGRLCAGPQKAVQKFALQLFTRRGTVIGDRSFGTDFMTNLSTGNVRTDADLAASFNIAAKQAINYILRNASTKDQPDEIPVDAKLLSFSLDHASATIKVQLTTKAGNTRVVVLPTTVSIR